ncbi:uncharacterized protein LOC129457245 isoform X2 [Periophthalmus magnuspinnatus]|uniref:uncharacterized protein LOC129457245 isoform X2 n=1 Tax=Periophthalmus magnuspinnatus TaxID=409849 RepID=UPI0024364D4A|nr:uncharacterized protein LOC129457245 isoform X2 [Periophthalmus magnuspinnatus]
MKLAVTIVTTLVFATLLPQTSTAIPERSVSCALKENCSLACPFTGNIKEAYWIRMDYVTFPIVYYPEDLRHLRHEFRNMSFLKLDPADGAVLRLTRVEVQHEGVYRCYVKTDLRTTRHQVHLKVYSPVLQVSLQQQGQQLVCRSERVYPEPSVSWSPPSLGSQPQTSVNVSEDGLYSVYSSLSGPLNSTLYTCNVSTPYSWRVDTIRPQIEEDSSYLKYLWILTVLILIPACFFIFKKVEVQGAGRPQNGEVTTSNQHENGHCHRNGLNHMSLTMNEDTQV